ncbi:hypothetical protein HER39_14315 [Arthrobacter deserti]|uniref:Cyclohexanone monooxygenase n=1 Tax=Arthrobacter deserti TaxID=1742687 RepID=A0ABX1JQV2_9MICC|nr:hypothetical protein [Arthrobacter deserti]
MAYLKEHGLDVIDPEQDAEDKWVAHANELAQATLLPGTDSWYMGANIPGKPRKCLVYLGGAPAYRAICEEIVAKSYEGFALQPARTALAAS